MSIRSFVCTLREPAACLDRDQYRRTTAVRGTSVVNDEFLMNPMFAGTLAWSASLAEGASGMPVLKRHLGRAISTGGVSLTAASYQRRLDPRSGGQSGRARRGEDAEPAWDRQMEGHQRRGRLVFILAAIAFAVCELAGMAAVVHSYLVAQTTLSTPSEFASFWVGMALLELPIAALVARRAASAKARIALVTLFGFVTYAPKLLRNTTSPLYHDEFAHWRATYNILSRASYFNQIRSSRRSRGTQVCTPPPPHLFRARGWRSGRRLPCS